MSANVLVVDAAVAAVEHPVLDAFASQLADCLAHASGDRWSVDVRAHARIESLAPGDGSHVVVASLQCELDGGDTIAEVDARWGERVSALVPRSAAVLLCTIARTVTTPLPALAAAESTPLERLRRLDRLAVDLSHATGAAVADIDRVVAYFGARSLGCDHRLGTAPAAEVAAWTLVATLVALGTLDDFAGPGATERAAAFLGNLAGLPRFVHKRMQAG